VVFPEARTCPGTRRTSPPAETGPLQDRYRLGVARDDVRLDAVERQLLEGDPYRPLHGLGHVTAADRLGRQCVSQVTSEHRASDDVAQVGDADDARRIVHLGENEAERRLPPRLGRLQAQTLRHLRERPVVGRAQRVPLGMEPAAPQPEITHRRCLFRPGDAQNQPL